MVLLKTMALIEYQRGDILQADVEALVNSVNCVGIMGRGIALQYKNHFPDNFLAYQIACKHGKVQPGQMFVFETSTLTNPKFIINFPTKRHWRGKSRIEDIDSGLKALVNEIRSRGIRSIAIPPLGSGLGGLDWANVRMRIEAALRDIEDVKIIVFEPISESVPTASREVPAMTASRAALVALIDRYLRGLMEPFVSLLEIHKLMYFMQEAGEPLDLRYTKGQYGPYAENLRHVLKAIEGHLVSSYFDGGDAPNKPIELVPGALKDAEQFLSNRRETLDRLDSVNNLIDGFETPFGLELLATVHWVVKYEQVTDVEDTTTKFYAWNPRKKRYSPHQVGIALETLNEKKWLPAEYR